MFPACTSYVIVVCATGPAEWVCAVGKLALGAGGALLSGIKLCRSVTGVGTGIQCQRLAVPLAGAWTALCRECLVALGIAK